MWCELLCGCVYCVLRPRPVFTTKGEHGVHVVHDKSTLHLPRNILAFVQKDLFSDCIRSSTASHVFH